MEQRRRSSSMSEAAQRERAAVLEERRTARAKGRLQTAAEARTRHPSEDAAAHGVSDRAHLLGAMKRGRAVEKLAATRRKHSI